MNEIFFLIHRTLVVRAPYNIVLCAQIIFYDFKNTAAATGVIFSRTV